MYFIEWGLMISAVTFMVSVCLFVKLENKKVLYTLVFIEIISIFSIIVFLLINLLCDSLITCIAIWFGNW